MPASSTNAELPADEALSRARHDLERLLRYRPRSLREAEQRLLRKGFSSEIVRQVLAQAQERGWLDDEAFAKLWISDRLLTKPKGARALRSELRAKGVPDQMIERALERAELDETALARQLLQARLARYAADDPQSRERKLTAFLARRGFAYQVIRTVLRELAQ